MSSTSLPQKLKPVWDSNQSILSLQLYAQSVVVPPACNIPETWLRRLFPELADDDSNDEGYSLEFDERFEQLMEFLLRNPGPTLIYVALQQQTEIHAQVLWAHGFKVAAFHAGMKTDEKKQVQEAFMSDKIQVVSESCVQDRLATRC